MPLVDRRAFLLTCAATVATAGCTSTGPRPPAVPSEPPTVEDPDAGIRAQVGRSERELIEAYALAVAAVPALRTALAPLAAHHGAHLLRVTGEAPPSEPAEAPPADARPTGAAGGAAPVDPPIEEVLAGLMAAEQRALAQRGASCDRAVDPDLARDLALIAASEAQHADVVQALLAATRPEGS